MLQELCQVSEKATNNRDGVAISGGNDYQSVFFCVFFSIFLGYKYWLQELCQIKKKRQISEMVLQSVLLIIWGHQSVRPSMPNVIIHYVIRVAI